MISFVGFGLCFIGPYLFIIFASIVCLQGRLLSIEVLSLKSKELF